MKEQCHNHFRKNLLSQKLWQTEEEVIYSILCCLPIGIICHVVVHMMCTASMPHVALIKAQIHFFYWIWDVLHKLVSSIVLGPKNVNYESHLSLKLLWAPGKKGRLVNAETLGGEIALEGVAALEQHTAETLEGRLMMMMMMIGKVSLTENKLSSLV